MGFPESERRAIAYEVGVQNTALPLTIVYVSFGTGIDAIDYIPFLGIHTIVGFIVNYGTCAILRYCLPIPEEIKAQRAEEAIEDESGKVATTASL